MPPIRFAKTLRAGSIALFSLLLAAPAVQAQDAPYTHEQIVQGLIASIDLGVARAVCIGTQADCAPQKSEGLDMRVGFAFDSDALDAPARAALTVFAEALQDTRLEAAHFRVEGHTDAIGTEAYNLDLSQRRAVAVRSFLLDQGLPPARLNAIGLGQSQPRMPDPRNGANRRVELHAVLQ